MKKTLSMMLVLAMLLSVVLCFTACTASTAGTYYFYKATIDGETYTADDLEDELDGEMDLEDFVCLELEKDGTGTLTYMGEEIDIEWDDEEIWPEDDEDEAIDYKKDGDEITIKIEGDKLVFKKDK